jgi:hypothetical protein
MVLHPLHAVLTHYYSVESCQPDTPLCLSLPAAGAATSWYAPAATAHAMGMNTAFIGAGRATVGGPSSGIRGPAPAGPRHDGFRAGGPGIGGLGGDARTQHARLLLAQQRVCWGLQRLCSMTLAICFHLEHDLDY